jgi:hypothetical protein
MFTVCAMAILFFRLRIPRTSVYLNNQRMFVLLSLCLPLFIGLFFAAGKITSLPFLLRPGVREMNNFGCCSQGLLYPQNMALNMIQWYEEKKVGFVDMLTEDYANMHGFKRWAMFPSVLQHVARKSSKGDDMGVNAKYERTVAEKIWSFGFENYDAERLREEHDLIP